MEALERENLVPAVLAARATTQTREVLLTRLWMLGEVLTDSQVSALGLNVGELTHAGLLETHGDQVRAAVDLRPYTAMSGAKEQHWWVASDLGEGVTQRELRPDHVLGIGGASTTLASFTVRTPVERLLDLGTGCGIQALHGSGHAHQVVATDISARALAFARFNAALNGVHLDVREGSMFKPVEGELFDLVVSNPPFVIAPPGSPQYDYRSADTQGDSLMRSLIQGVGTVLRPGGIAQFLGNWEIAGGQSWDERLGHWIDDAELDAWVIQRDVLDPAQYAETWLRDAGLAPERNWAAYVAATEAYLSYFDSRGVESIGMGMVMLRRPAGTRTMRRLESFEGTLPQGLGDHVAAVLAAHDRLIHLADDDVLDIAVTVALDVTDERYFRPGSPHPEHILLRQGGGLGRTVKADTVVAAFVGACDGELTVRQIAHAVAALLDLDAGEVVRGLVPAVRDMVVDGFLELP